MIQFIGSVFKYTGLVIAILVLSHVIEIKGVSISKHVEHTMNWVTGINPTVDVGKVGREISASVQSHLDQIKKVDAEFSPEDQEQLNELIKKAERKKASH